MKNNSYDFAVSERSDLLEWQLLELTKEDIEQLRKQDRAKDEVKRA